MIRKTIMVVLTLAAILTGVLGLVGFSSGVYADFSITDRFWFYVHSQDALVRLYVFNAEQDIYLSPSGSYRYLSIYRAVDDGLCLRFRHAVPPQISPYAFYWREVRQTARARRMTILMSGLRTRVGLPVALFIAYPLVAVIRNRWKSFRRPKSGYCRQCGYDLTGNASGVCPECGSAIAFGGDNLAPTRHPRR